MLSVSGLVCRVPRLRFVASIITMLLLTWGALGTAQAQTVRGSVVNTLGSGFSNPYDVAVDGSGNVYVADYFNSLVKEIVAVNGVIPATPTILTLGSGFSQPRGVAVDGSGNVYVADTNNNAVKEIVAVNGVIPASPTINTLGGGFSNPAGVAVDGSGNVYVAGGSGVQEIVAVGGVIPASPTIFTLGSGFLFPQGIAVDGNGNVYVGDGSGLHEIVAVNGVIPASPTILTLGSGFGITSGVAVDGSGNVYVADDGHGAVKEIVAVNGVIPASPTVLTLNSSFGIIGGVSVDGSGNVYVADVGNNAVKELSPTYKFPATAVASMSSAVTVTFTFDTGGTLAANPYAVLTQGAQGKDFQAATTQGAGVCLTGHTYNPGDVCTVAVTFSPTLPYQRTGSVQLMGTNGPVATFLVNGIGTGPQVAFLPGVTTTLGNANSVAADENGNIFVTNYNFSNDTGTVTKIVVANGVVSSSTIIGSGFGSPIGTAVDGSGNVFVTEYNNGVVKEIVAGTGGNLPGAVNAASTVNTIFNDTNVSPYGVAVDKNGNVFFTDPTNARIYEIVAVNGVVSSSSLVNLLSSANEFNTPQGVAVDGSGNVFVVDSGNNAVYEMVAVNGVVTSNSAVNAVGSGFSRPFGIAMDRIGNVYVADGANKVVKEIVAGTGGNLPGAVSAASTVNTVALVDNGQGFAQDVAVDGSGNIIFGDPGLVKEIVFTPPSLTFAPTTVNSTSSDSPQTVTLQNIGNASLSFLVPSLGMNPSITPTSFLLNSGGGSACPQISTSSSAGSLAAGASCTLPVSFAPTAVGLITGTLVLTDNNLNANPSTTQTIPLSGTGVAIPTSTVVASSLPSAVVGLSVTFTATVTSTVGSTVPTGTVQFTVDGTNLGTPVALNGSGVATFPTSALAVGSHTVRAIYTDPSGNFVGSTGSTTQSIVAPVATHLNLTGGAAQSAVIGVQFAAPLQVQLLDQLGNPMLNQTITFTAPASAASATLSSSAQVTNASGTASVTATANSTPGSYTVTAAVSGLTASFNLTNLPIPNFTVNTVTDDGSAGANGTAGNCNAGNVNTCTLRDAIAAASAAGNGTITFDPSVFGSTPVTIPLTTAGLTIPSGTVSIIGPGANLLTVSGEGNGTVVTVNSGVTGSVSGVTLAGGNGASAGGASNAGSLTLTNVAVSGNTSAGTGGVNNTGTLTVTGSTLSGNTSSGGAANAGGISNIGGTAIIVNSTITQNTATAGATGGIYNTGTLTAKDDTVSQNTGATGSGGITNISPGTVTAQNDILAGNTNQGGASEFSGFAPAPDSSNITNATGLNLAPLGYFGGPVQTLPPVPGSTAICGGVIANIYAGLTIDQRGTGYPRTTSYSANACVDAGAVQTNFSVAFVTQPTSTVVSAVIAPSPTVQLKESGVAFAYAGTAIPVRFGSGSKGSLHGTLTQNTNGSGVATYTDLSGDTIGTGDTLLATLVVTSKQSLTAPSAVFNLGQATATVTLGNLNVTYNGHPQSATATTSPSGVSVTYTYNGLSTAPIVVGSYTVVATISNPNYTGSATGTLVISPKEIHIGVASVTITYGDTYPTFTALVNGLAIGDTATNIGLVFATPLGTTSTSEPGMYPITATNTDPNYIVTANTPGILTIKPIPATVALASTTITYDGLPHSLAVTTAPGGLGVAYTYNGLSTTPTAAGNYNVVAKTTDPHYSGTGTGTLTIKRAPLTVAVNNATMTYGGTYPTLGGTPSGLAGSDTAASIVTYATTTPTTNMSTPGTYPITATIKSPNYTLTVTPGTLTINAAVATVTLGSMGGVYNGQPYAGAATISPSGVGVTYTYNSSSTAPTAAGSYTVVATVTGPNYTGTATGTMTITKAPLAVAVNSVTMTYGGTYPTLSGTPTGLAGSDTAASIVTYATTTPTTNMSTPGTYPIGATITSLNYTLTVIPGTLTINVAVATVTLGSMGGVYNGHPYSATATTSPSGLGVTYTYNGSSTAPTAAGSYPVVATITGPNYTGTATGTMVISPAALMATITGNPTKVYDGTRAATLTSANYSLSGFIGTEGATVTQPLGTYAAATVGPEAVTATLGAMNFAAMGTTNLSNYTLPMTALGAGTISKASSTLTWANPGAITYGTSLSVAQLDATASTAGTLVYTPAASTVLNAGSYTLSVAFTPTDTTNFGPAMATVPLTVNKQPTTSQMALSTASVRAGGALTLTISVLPATSGTPTGTVAIFDNGTMLTTVTLSSGTSSFTTSALTVGTHVLSTIYSGDGNYTTSTASSSSGANTVTVTPATTPDFTLGTTTPSLTVDPGAFAAFTITVGPTSGLPFNNPVTLSVTGLPPNFGVVFTPATVMPGSSTVTSQMSVHTYAETTSHLDRNPSSLPYGAIAACLLLPLLGVRRLRKKLPKSLLYVLFLSGALGATTALTGCGGGYFGPPPATYTLTVTGTSGSLQHSTTVTLKVQ